MIGMISVSFDGDDFQNDLSVNGEQWKWKQDLDAV